ncbi:tetratricopeptide repeat protein [Terriglobus sp. RCC_193]|uniref:tetratricopeptide repeat protein n=1 Tax=Terriglobus sp. RCC_193 TaxID=3239218 RepID=UPI003526B85A
MRRILLIPSVALTLIGVQATTAQSSSPKNNVAHSSTASCAARTMTPEDAAKERKALASLDANDVASAQPDLVALAKKYPCRFELQAAAGMALAEAENVNAAVPFLRQAHARRPTDDAIAFNLALAELKTGNVDSALPLLQKVASRNPNRADTQLALAAAFMQSKRPSDAAAAFKKASMDLTAGGQAVPLELRMDWASALLQSHRPSEARDVLRSADGLQQSAPALALLAETAEATGDYEEAARSFESAARLDPSEPMIVAYGNELLQHRTFGPAIEILKYGTEKFPESQRMHLALGAAYFNNAMYPLAAPEFYTMLLRSPNDTLAADMLGRSCADATAASLQECTALEGFAKEHPENAVAATYAATAILQRPTEARDSQTAEHLLQNALRADPKLADTWYQMGILQQSRNQWNESAASLEHAIALQPDFADAHYRLSRAYSRMGRREEAIAEVQLEMKFRQENKDANSLRMQKIVRILTVDKQP